MLLSEYDIEYHTQKAIKSSLLADYLTHQPVDNYQSVKYYFPDEDVMFLKEKYFGEPLPGEGPDLESRWGMVFDGAWTFMGKELVLWLSLPMDHISHLL